MSFDNGTNTSSEDKHSKLIEDRAVLSNNGPVGLIFALMNEESSAESKAKHRNIDISSDKIYRLLLYFSENCDQIKKKERELPRSSRTISGPGDAVIGVGAETEVGGDDNKNSCWINIDKITASLQKRKKNEMY